MTRSGCVTLLLGSLLARGSASPHLVLYVVDDLGWADVGFNNASEIPTPNIDRLAVNSARLERYYTQPVCSPTRSTLMTGRFVHHTGFYQALGIGTVAALPADVPTLAERLRAAGYSTHMIGKWHLGYSRWADTPTGRGFETHYGYLQGEEDYYSKVRTRARPEIHLPSSRSDRSPAVNHRRARSRRDQVVSDGFDFWDGRTPLYGAAGSYSAEQYAARAAALLDASANATEPLFLYYAHQVGHGRGGATSRTGRRVRFMTGGALPPATRTSADGARAARRARRPAVRRPLRRVDQRRAQALLRDARVPRRHARRVRGARAPRGALGRPRALVHDRQRRPAVQVGHP